MALFETWRPCCFGWGKWSILSWAGTLTLTTKRSYFLPRILTQNNGRRIIEIESLGSITGTNTEKPRRTLHSPPRGFFDGRVLLGKTMVGFVPACLTSIPGSREEGRCPVIRLSTAGARLGEMFFLPGNRSSGIVGWEEDIHWMKDETLYRK